VITSNNPSKQKIMTSRATRTVIRREIDPSWRQSSIEGGTVFYTEDASAPYGRRVQLVAFNSHRDFKLSGARARAGTL
jgi:hypothetical protein